MRLLSQAHQRRLNAVERTTYDTLVDCVTRHPLLGYVPEKAGFVLVEDDTVVDDSTVWDEGTDRPFFATFELCFHNPAYPPTTASFGRYPEGIDVWIPCAARACTPKPCWALRPDEGAGLASYRSELSAFFDDWLEGRTSVHVLLAGGVPYRWTVERCGRTIWSQRRLIYPYFGKRESLTKCCPSTTPLGRTGDGLA